jgi:hypothetical protein
MFSVFLFQQVKEIPLTKISLFFNSAILILAIIFEVYQNGLDWGILIKCSLTIIYFFLRKSYPWLSSMFLFVVLVFELSGTFENGQINFFFLVVVLFTLFHFINKLKKIEQFHSLLFVICFIGFTFPIVHLIQNPSIESKHENSSRVETNKINGLFKGDGRALEYVENTLVAPHSASEKIATGFSTLSEYFRLMVFPKELSFYYGYSKITTTNFNDWMVWLGILIHLILVGLAIWKIRVQPIMSLGIFWYITSILLFSNWVELVAGMVGERLAFTASAGFSIFFAGLIFWIKPDFNWRKPKWVEFSVFVILILLATRTFVRNADWKDAVTLMSHDIKHLGKSAQANNLLALNLAKYAEEQTDDNLRKRYFKKAQHHFKRAFEIYPPFGNAYYDFARVSMTIGENKTAVFGLEKSIEYNPTFNQPYVMLCEYYELQKDFGNYERIAKSWIQNAAEEKAYISLARVYFLREDFQKAFSILEKGKSRLKSNESIKSAINELDQFVKQNKNE